MLQRHTPMQITPVQDGHAAPAAALLVLVLITSPTGAGRIGV